jgi:hypothetical protein
VLTADQMRTLFATCEKGKEFVDRRDGERTSSMEIS